MAAPPQGTGTAEGVVLGGNRLKDCLIDFSKFEAENPHLQTSECAERFLEKVGREATQQCQAGGGSAEIKKGQEGDGEEAVTGAALVESQRMGHSVSASLYIPPFSSQQAFALRAGRSPRQFLNSNPLLSQKQEDHQFHQLQMLQMGSSAATPALMEYLGQQDSSEPFRGLRHAIGDASSPEYAGAVIVETANKDAMGKPLPTLPLDGTTPLDVYAPRMQAQISSSTSGYFTSEEAPAAGNGSSVSADGFPEGPRSYTMNRHTRSYSQGSYGSSYVTSSQPESLSPTDHRFSSSPGYQPPAMSRQTSSTSLPHGGMAMLRVASEPGEYHSFDTHGERDLVLACVGGGGSGGSGTYYGHRLVEKPVGGQQQQQQQHKRASSVTVEDLDNLTVADAGMQRGPSGDGGKQARGQKRVKEDAVPVVAVATAAAAAVAMTFDSEDSHEAASEKETRPKKSRQQQQRERKKDGEKSLVSPYAGYVRRPHPRVHCTLCTDNPDGFRGDHELRRHTDREHKTTKTFYVIKDRSEDGLLLAGCRSCQSGKRYHVDYNAAAHLRRQHYNPNKDENGRNLPHLLSPDGKQPPMSTLRDWIEPVEVRVERSDTEPDEPVRRPHKGKSTLQVRAAISKEPANEDPDSTNENVALPHRPTTTTATTEIPLADDVGHLLHPGLFQDMPPDIFWDQSATWHGSADSPDQHLARGFGVQYSITGGTLSLDDALAHLPPNANMPADHQRFLMDQRMMGLPFEPGETNTNNSGAIFNNLPGPAGGKDTSGIFNGGMGLPDLEEIKFS